MSYRTALLGLSVARASVPAVRCILLACVLVLAQGLLALHGVEHLEHLERDQCETCVTGAPLGAAQVATELRPMASAQSATSPPTAIAPPAPRVTFSAHRARAPPTGIRQDPLFTLGAPA